MELEEREKLIEDYRKFLNRRNLAPNTLNAYCTTVNRFLILYEETTVENLQKYRDGLLGDYKPSTVNQRIQALNHYIRFLLEEDEEQYMPLKSFRLTTVRVQQKSFLDTIISNEDYEYLKRKLKEDHNYYWYFVIRFLGSTGARVSELTQIKIEHLRLGYLDLYSKGGKLRRIYFPDTLCEEALNWYTSQGRTSGFLFLNKAGKRISARGIHSQLKHFAKVYGIDPDTVYPHSFRHRFAKNFLNRFNDISLLADLMGHESIETTRIYLTKSSQEQQALLDELVTW